MDASSHIPVCVKGRGLNHTADDRKKSVAKRLFKSAQKVLFNGPGPKLHMWNVETCAKKCTYRHAKHLHALKRDLAFFFQEQLFTDSGCHRLDALKVFPQLRDAMEDVFDQTDGSELLSAFNSASFNSAIFRDSPLPSLSLFAIVKNDARGEVMPRVFKTPGHCPSVKKFFPFDKEKRTGDVGISKVYSDGIDVIDEEYKLSSTQEGLFTVPLYPKYMFEAARSIVKGKEHDLARSSAGLFLTIPTEPFVPFVREIHLQAFVSFVFAHQIFVGKDKTGLPELVLQKIHDFIAES